MVNVVSSDVACWVVGYRVASVLIWLISTLTVLFVWIVSLFVGWFVSWLVCRWCDDWLVVGCVGCLVDRRVCWLAGWLVVGGGWLRGGCCVAVAWWQCVCGGG